MVIGRFNLDSILMVCVICGMVFILVLSSVLWCVWKVDS